LTNSVVATIKAGGTPRFLAVGEKGVWVLNQQDGTVSRIDPMSNKEIAVINTQVQGTGGDIAAGNGYVWVRAKGRLLQKINPFSNTIETMYYPAAGSGAVRTTDRFIWVTAHDKQTIWVLKK
jgi:DNA-binding beta-propeller fold protein YncE